MTNGVISIVKDGVVVIKLVTGHDGMKAPFVAEELRNLSNVPTPEQAEEIALRQGFGSSDSLVVATKDNPYGRYREDAEAEPEMHKRYRDTFDDPRANPRWQHEAPYTEVVAYRTPDDLTGEMEAAGRPSGEGSIRDQVEALYAASKARLRKMVDRYMDGETPYEFGGCPVRVDPTLRHGEWRFEYPSGVGELESVRAIAERSPLAQEVTGALDLSKAFEIAVQVHGKQRDQAGEPYMGHVCRVMSAMRNDAERCVAILHDTVEDTPGPFVCPPNSYMPTEKFKVIKTIEHVYGKDIALAIFALTRFEGEEYAAYLLRLSKNPLAVRIKLADLADNLRVERLCKIPDHDKMLRLQKRYLDAQAYLQGLPQCS